MQTVHGKTQLEWHLRNNILPALGEAAVNGILELCARFNAEEIDLYDTDPLTGLEVCEIFSDLQIDVTDELMLEYDDTVNDSYSQYGD